MMMIKNDAHTVLECLLIFFQISPFSISHSIQNAFFKTSVVDLMLYS